MQVHGFAHFFFNEYIRKMFGDLQQLENTEEPHSQEITKNPGKVRY